MKKCGTCLEVKPFDAFYPDAAHKDGYRSRCKTCRAEKSKEWRAARLAINPDYDRNQNLKRLYGITLEEYEAKLEQQGRCCAICRQPQGEKSFHVDHNHDTGANRGILCDKCNVGVGMFSDDPETLRAAALYIEEWS